MEKEIKITILYDDTQKLYNDTEKPTEDFDIKNLKNPKQDLLKKLNESLQRNQKVPYVAMGLSKFEYMAIEAILKEQ